jgi:cell division septal protein FtsQ
VTPRQPVAVVRAAGGDAIVGADGVVVAVAAPATVGDLVAVDGPAGLAAGDRFEDRSLLQVAAALPSALRAAVAGIGAGDGEGAVELRLVDGGVVRLGAADQLGAKLVAVATVLEQVDTACLTALDVRVPAAPTVTRAQGC